MQGGPGFDLYDGQASMYKVHKFMRLNNAEVTYFIQQVGLAAASFGVAAKDIQAVATALNTIFNVRCAPPVQVIKAQGPQLQSICIDAKTCKLAPGAHCDMYENLPPPDMASPSMPLSNGTSSYGPSPTGSMGPGSTGAPNGPGGSAGGSSRKPPSDVKGSAAGVTVSLAAAMVALAAFLQ